MAREGQAEGVVLAVGCVGHMDFAQHRGIECTGCAEAVDAQGIVAAVLGCPLLVVDHARRNHVHVDVGEHVCAYNHRAVLIVEGFHHLGEGCFVSIYIVRVELDGEFAALLVVDTHVPATADAEVVALGDDVDYTGIAGEFLDSLGCAVGRVIVDDDEVEGEVGLLAEDTADGVADGADTVADGDNYRSLILEVALVEFDCIELGRQVAADSLEVIGACSFHLDLYAAVLGIDVAEDSLAGFLLGSSDVGIEIFVDVNDGSDAAQTQTQVVKAGSLVVGCDAGGSLLEINCVEHQQ